MPTGKIKWFSAEKGFGFIKQDSSNQDVFVHWTAVDGLSDFEELRDGESVTFEVERSEKGLKATNVKRVEETAI